MRVGDGFIIQVAKTTYLQILVSPRILATYYGFQTVCKCPFRALLVTLATDSYQTWTN